MFGSAHAGERAAAALLADKLVREEYGLSWPQIITAARSEPPPPDSEAETRIKFALDRAALLNDWERTFLASIKGRWHLSEKQWGKLHDIVAKVKDHNGRQ